MNAIALIQLAELAAQGIQSAVKIGASVTAAIQASKELTDADKAELISRIRQAQTSVPEWK